MKITEIDKKFDTTFVYPPDVKWHSILDEPFKVYGLFYSQDEKMFRRFPKAFADAINERVAALATNTAGGRVRFRTNSPYIVLRVEEPFDEPFPHMTMLGKNGISVFVDNSFVNAITPTYQQMIAADPNVGGSGKIVFDGIIYLYDHDGHEHQVEVVFPLYSGVYQMFVGLKKQSTILPPTNYKYEKPVIFYGSSITQGGCASKPGDDYINRLSRMLDTNYINFGLSGNAKAEPEMADFIAKQDASIFVLDYDYNAPDEKYLQKTHFSLYKKVRDVNPETPIIIMTMPAFSSYKNRSINKARRDVIFGTFEKAKSLGDNNLYLIDCYGCFGETPNDEGGTVDDCHPNSLGFLRMAEKVYPILKDILEK